MKKNDAAYFNLSADDPVYHGSSIMFSSAVILQDDQEPLLTLNMDGTNFLIF